MSTNLIYHSFPLLLPRAAGAIAGLGGRLYDQIPEEVRGPLLTYVNYASMAALVVVPIIGVLASVKVTYIALAALATFVCFLFVSELRGVPNSRRELDQQFVEWSAEGDLRKIAFAINAGADLDARDDRNGRCEETALIKAAAGGHTSAVQMLVELGADATIEDRRGRTALQCAIKHGHTSTVFKLIELLLVDINAQETEGGSTPLFMAAFYGKIEIVEALLAQGAQVDGRSGSSNWTALMIAARKGHISVVQALARRGAGINLRNDDGWTALIVAARRGKADVVRLLMSLGADITVRDECGSTALDYALAHYPEIARLFPALPPTPPTAD